MSAGTDRVRPDVRVQLDDRPVLVRGATLAGMAAAARLAKQGHVVQLDPGGLPEGGHWSAHEVGGVMADDLPQTFLLPAAWRDLFKKSGRAMDAELERHGLALVPAPAQRHLFADGRHLDLPAERGAQVHAIEDAFGRGSAERWRDLLDLLDELWQELRQLGLERPFDAGRLDRAARARLLHKRTLDDLAERVQDAHLATIIRSQASLCGAPPGRAPALLAVRLAVHRRFGSWQLVDAGGIPQRASRLVELLSERLDLRGVARGPLDGEPAATIEATPVRPDGFWARHDCPPALAPSVRHRVVELPAGGDATGIVEQLDHSAGNPLVSWLRPLGDGRAVRTIHDHRQVRPELAWGLAPVRFASWERRPLLQGPDRTWRASCASHAGNEPWAELLSAALASYEVHELRTGEDIRPTNRDQPPPRRQARPSLTTR